MELNCASVIRRARADRALSLSLSNSDASQAAKDIKPCYQSMHEFCSLWCTLQIMALKLLKYQAKHKENY